MMSTQKKSYLVKYLYLLIGAIALLTITGIIGINHYTQSPAYQLATAKKRWATGGRPEHYQLKIKQVREASCQQELEIKNEQVIAAIKQKDCQSMPDYTVANLFNLIESNLEEEKCGPNGCECDGKFVVNAKYDRATGYPKQVELDLKKSFSLLQLLQAVLPQNQSSACTLIGTQRVNLRVSLQTIKDR